MQSTAWVSLQCAVLREKKPDAKGSMPYGSILVAFWKRQNYRRRKGSVVSGGGERLSPQKGKVMGEFGR